jgi:hypothetical protein
MAGPVEKLDAKLKALYSSGADLKSCYKAFEGRYAPSFIDKRIEKLGLPVKAVLKAGLDSIPGEEGVKTAERIETEYKKALGNSGLKVDSEETVDQTAQKVLNAYEEAVRGTSLPVDKSKTVVENTNDVRELDNDPVKKGFTGATIDETTNVGQQIKVQVENVLLQEFRDDHERTKTYTEAVSSSAAGEHTPHSMHWVWAINPAFSSNAQIVSDFHTQSGAGKRLSQMFPNADESKFSDWEKTLWVSKAVPQEIQELCGSHGITIREASTLIEDLSSVRHKALLNHVLGNIDGSMPSFLEATDVVRALALLVKGGVYMDSNYKILDAEKFAELTDHADFLVPALDEHTTGSLTDADTRSTHKYKPENSMIMSKKGGEVITKLADVQYSTLLGNNQNFLEGVPGETEVQKVVNYTGPKAVGVAMMLVDHEHDTSHPEEEISMAVGGCALFQHGTGLDGSQDLVAHGNVIGSDNYGGSGSSSHHP